MRGAAVSALLGLACVAPAQPQDVAQPKDVGQSQAPGQPQALAPLVDASGAIGAAWRVVGLPQQKPPLTRYSATQLDGRPALRIEARGSYGNLVHELPARPVPQRVAWSWRLDRPNERADLHARAGDDSAVKVCLSFDLALERVPFVERQLLRLARARSGEPLPAATLSWVWDPRETPGTLIDNAYSRRVRYLVVRGAGDALGRWADESRDAAADFRRAFGDESAQTPPASALIVAADADNTGAESLAYVAALRLLP